MFKLSHNCNNFTCQQGNAQNPSSQASVHEPQTSRCALDLEKAEEPEIKLPTFTGSQKQQGNLKKKHTFNFTDYTKAFDSVDHHKL